MNDTIDNINACKCNNNDDMFENIQHTVYETACAI